MDMVLYEKPMATEFSQPTPFIHDHSQQAVRGILNEMEQQNEVIKELFGLLECKVFTDNQKERLTWGYIVLKAGSDEGCLWITLGTTGEKTDNGSHGDSVNASRFATESK
ncbi:hypothetical protein Dimus_003545 [Dionaea muscipula]